MADHRKFCADPFNQAKKSLSIEGKDQDQAKHRAASIHHGFPFLMNDGSGAFRSDHNEHYVK